MVRPPHLIHLAKRFFGSLRPGGPAPADEAWVERLLLPGERDLWRQMSGADRRHAVAVARTVASTHDDRPVLAAALLHDVGKIDSGLGTWARALVTALSLGMGRERIVERGGRAGSYLRHDAIGADLLAAAGSDPLTVAWAREHHLHQDRWTVPLDVGEALKAADDD